MPSMTMVFRTANKTMIEQVKLGDTIKFRADMVGGYLTVTHIEK